MTTPATPSNTAGTLSTEETNYLRAAHLIIHVCPKAVSKLFDSHHPPSELNKQLASQQTKLKSCKGIFKFHWPVLFPSNGNAESSEFDIKLLIALLRNFTTIPPPSTGWDAMPAAGDKSVGADVVRIRLYRNQIVHSNDKKLTKSNFNSLWAELNGAIHRLSGGTMEMEEDDIRRVILDQTQRVQLLTSIQHERELKNHEEETEEENENCNQATEKVNLPTSHRIEEQSTRKINQWRNYDDVFYETTGYKASLELLNDTNYICIIGSPGSGKSAIAKHIALQMEGEGWEIVSADGVNEMIEYCSLSKKQLFVIDDVVGVFGVEMDRLDAILGRKPEILNLIQNETKMIMTCRKDVYNEAKQYKSLVTDFVVDLEDSEFKLKENEKREILLNHCRAVRISLQLFENVPLSNANFMFPLLSSLFCKHPKYQSMGKEFFEKPNEYLLKTLTDLRKKQPIQYAGLVLLCLTKKRTLSVESICENQKKDVFDILGISYETSNSDVMKAFELLDGIYIKPSSDINYGAGEVRKTFTFIHDFIFELVAYHHGISNPEQILKYASSSYVNNRITVEDPPSDGGLYIKLEKNRYGLLAERLIEDIKAFKLYDAFKNSYFKREEFLDVFIEILREMDLMALKEIFLQSYPQLQKNSLCTRHEADTSTQSAIDEADTHVRMRVKELLETDDTIVIRWIVFYGPTRLLEFVVIDVLKPEKTHTLEIADDQILHQERKSNNEKKNIRLLIIGCFCGDVDRVRLILRYINPSCANTLDNLRYNSYTPLTAACYCGHLAIVEILSQNGVGLDMPDERGCTPLSVASKGGHCDIVGYLIDHGVDPNTPDNHGNTPLHIASSRGQCNIVRCLIEHGSDPNIQNKSNHRGYAPLHVATEEGHLDIVSYLIDHGADVNILDGYGYTPLYKATNSGHFDIVRYLMGHGADPNIHNIVGKTPLYATLNRKRPDIFWYLIEHGAHANTPSEYGKSLLHMATQRGFYDIVRYLIDHGADPNASEGDFVVLFIASVKGDCNIARYLLDHGADPNTRIMCGYRPLSIASFRGHAEVVRLLLENSADMNCSSFHGNSPLQIALYYGHLDVVRTIMKHENKEQNNQGNYLLYNVLIHLKHLEVNTEETSRRGRTVYKECIRTKLSEGIWDAIMKRPCGNLGQLLKLGLDVNLCDEIGASLLCTVIQERSSTETEKKVKLLLDSGADINIRDDKNKSVIEHTQLCKDRNPWNKSAVNKYRNVLNVIKCRARRFSV